MSPFDIQPHRIELAAADLEHADWPAVLASSSSTRTARLAVGRSDQQRDRVATHARREIGAGGRRRVMHAGRIASPCVTAVVDLHDLAPLTVASTRNLSGIQDVSLRGRGDRALRQLQHVVGLGYDAAYRLECREAALRLDYPASAGPAPDGSGRCCRLDSAPRHTPSAYPPTARTIRTVRTFRTVPLRTFRSHSARA